MREPPSHALPLSPPGIVVNLLKGDPAEHRANSWLEWDGTLDLDVAFVGAPFDGASTVRPGSRHGPDAVRTALAFYTAHSTDTGRPMSDLRAADIGDITVTVTDKPATFARITETISVLVSRGIRPMVIGGDHSIAEATIGGLCDALPGRRIGIVHFDAHHDLREAHFGAESSGVPFRNLLEKRPDQVRGKNLTQIGIADFCNTPVHQAYAAEKGVTVISNLAVRRDGTDAAIDVALAHATDGTDAFWISVDVDAIDQSQAPGTAAPNPFGLDGRDVALALRRLAADPRCAGAEIVEISPPLDVNDMTSNLGAVLALNFFYGVYQRKA